MLPFHVFTNNNLSVVFYLSTIIALIVYRGSLPTHLGALIKNQPPGLHKVSFSFYGRRDLRIVEPSGNAFDVKIKDAYPEQIVADCLSCQLKFNRLMPFKVQHPIR